MPTLEYVKQEQTQEKPSIRDQLSCRENAAGKEVSGQIQNARHGVVRKETHEEIHRC